MALPSPVDSPASAPDTPTPYRVSTEAVRVWAPPQPSTEQLRIIRASIEPNRGFWQFPLPRMPWEAVLAFRVWLATVSIGAVGIAAYLTWAGH